MIKKSFLLLVGLLLLVPGGTSSADTFELSGPGIQVYGHDLEGDEQVQPGGVITVTISNNRPGYQRFLIYLTGKDENGNEVRLWGNFVGGTNCRPGSSCVFDLANFVTIGITAEELYVEGYFGQNGSRATVDHVTSNP
jgi:hypothetical protein